jgi:hypothetical protein
MLGLAWRGSTSVAPGAGWTAAIGVASEGSAITLSDIEGELPGPPDRPEDKVIRPGLFVLFRLALGPSADFYGPRFLAFERAGKPRVGWHWPALIAPAVWAFYRRLWGVGVAFTLLPLLGAVLLAVLAPWLGDYDWVWVASAFLLTVLLPGVAGSTLASALLYRKVRRRIRDAEAAAPTPAQVANRLVNEKPVSPHGAMAFGSLAAAVVVFVVGPLLTTAWEEHAVRVKLARALTALGPMKEQIEESWSAVRRWPGLPFVVGLPGRAGAMLDEGVSVDPGTGRVRLDLGSTVPELAGRAILLAPAIDQRDRIRWFCVPVGIPDRFLPQSCRPADSR